MRHASLALILMSWPAMGQTGPSAQAAAPPANTSSAAASATKAPDDCARWSLEGVRLGMTLDEVRATHPEAVWEKGKDPSFWTTQPKDKNAHSVTLAVNGNVVSGVTVSYGSKGQLGINVKPEGLIGAMADRFGSPVAADVPSNQDGSDTLSRVTAWSNAACDLRILVNNVTIFSDGDQIPMLFATLDHPSELDKETDAEKAKVKF